MARFVNFRIRRCVYAATLGAALALPLAGCASFGVDGGAETEDSSASLPALLRVAGVTLEGGDALNAASLYRRAHELYPDAAEPLVGLGRALDGLGQTGEAIVAYRLALVRDPAEKNALRNLGAALLSTGAAEEARAPYGALLALDAEDHRALNGQGVALDMLGRHAEAWPNYRRGLEIAPGNIALSNNYGLSLAMGGNTEEGIQVLSVLARAPNASARTRQNLALALGLAGDLAAAKQIAALDLPPDQVAGNAAFYEYIRGLQPELGTD